MEGFDKIKWSFEFNQNYSPPPIIKIHHARETIKNYKF